uniref:Uncharacterized protein n=1 Tax=Meloidogyne enterolobii TaxID=390850 RepID=A0A6V7US34_MELEN|nr:unnamed protein product [Meloidogyne enterolobii]
MKRIWDSLGRILWSFSLSLRDDHSWFSSLNLKISSNTKLGKRSSTSIWKEVVSYV